LPAEMGIKVGHWSVEKSGKTDFMGSFQPILLARSIKLAQKIHFVSKADF